MKWYVFGVFGASTPLLNVVQLFLTNDNFPTPGFPPLSIITLVERTTGYFDNLPFRNLNINTVIFQHQPLSLLTIAALVATEGRAVETNDNPEL